MPASDNLIPEAHKLTVEEQSAGGKASAEARRRKRDLKKALESLLEKDFIDKSGNTVSGAEAIAMKQFEKALKGDTRAFEIVRDTAGQKPIEKVEVAQIEKEQSMQELRELFEDE